MTQIYKDPNTGEEHEFPDDATAQEIDKATRGFSQQPQQSSSPMEKMMNEVTGFNEHFKKYISDPAMGFVQETANVLPESLNMAKHFVENNNPVLQKLKEQGKYNLPDVPKFDVAPHTLPTQAGQAAALTLGASPLLKKGFSTLEKGAEKVSNLIEPITKSGIKNTVLRGHDALDMSASHKFSEVSEGVKSRDIKNFPVPENLKIDLSEYFPRTKAAKKLLNDAQEGKYDALRKIQSDLYKNGKDNLSSDLEVDRLRGHEMLEKRDDINELISKNLRSTGNEDLASLLDSARGDWKKLQEIYYNPKMNRAIIKMVDKSHRLIPKNIANVLQEESLPMQKLREFHPGLEENIAKHLRIKGITKNIRRYGIPATIGGLIGGYAGSHYNINK